MAGRIRDHDWRASPLGPAESWQQALRFAVLLLLNSRHPMFILWGPELTQIYNDAYRDTLGPRRHPAALGASARETWGESWAVIGTQIEQVMSGGGAGCYGDKPGGQIQHVRGENDVDWDCSLSPIHDETAPQGVGGVLGICRETTAQATARRASRIQYQKLVEAIDQGFCILQLIFDDAERVVDNRFVEINRVFGQQTGMRNALGRTIRELVPDIEPFWLDTYGKVARTGEPIRFVDHARSLGRWFDVYAFRIDEPQDGRVAVLFGDITAQKQAEQRLQESEQRFRHLVEGWAQAVWECGPHGPAWLADSGHPSEPSPGDGWLETVHRDDRAQLEQRWQEAVATGKPLNAEFRRRGVGGEWRWTNARAAPIHGPDGSIRKWVGMDIDITARRWAEEQLRESEARLAAIFTGASVGLSEIGMDGRFLRVNDEICRILGRSREEVLRLGLADVTYPLDLAPSMALVAKVLQTGGSARLDKRYRRPDGTLVWANSSATRLPDAEGRPGNLLVVTADLTERRKAEEALRDSVERQRLAVEVGRLATWDWNIRTNRTTWSDEHYVIQGYAIGEVEPSYETWTARLHPEDRAQAEAVLAQARVTRQDYVHEFRTLHPDGAIRWCSARGRFFYDEAGEAVRMIGVMIDVTERRTWEEAQKVLVGELQHRTRNLIAVVAAIADRTLKRAATLDAFKQPFQDRLSALSRIQGLLAQREAGQRVTFDALIAAELGGLGVLDADRGHPQVVLDGPRGVRLRSAMVQVFALGIHELATNAVKYGALSMPTGRLEVRWRVERTTDAGSRLHVHWRESGVPMPVGASASTMARGYGRELIERALPYQLQAVTRYEVGPGGISCFIAVPLERD
ncbi:MAG TPA: PAS domain-containing protein [Geminicoccus sp.]|uniref:PAS domain-containing protein n=1 Tax=Geminicoccus sp. TaxID=2024832 RepID=UPI002E343AFC|nr:PAS domain-containing protein [Geminicoccus sp.]HEX2526300.1 PAS domain-containing protein [Geminicoccus sp.]